MLRAVESYGRRVYPGFVQPVLLAFVSMKCRAAPRGARHLDLSRPSCQGRGREGERNQGLLRRIFRRARPDESILETVAWVFQETRLAEGKLTFRGGRVEPRAIHRTMLLTVEGERDDICSIGQTSATHRCAGACGPHVEAAGRRHSGGSRPLRRVRRAALGGAGVSAGEEYDSGDGLRARNPLFREAAPFHVVSRIRRG